MPRTTFKNSLPAFIADPGSVRKIPGRQIDWDTVDDAFIVEETGKKRFPAGTVVAELSDGKLVEYGATDASLSPPADATAVGLLASEANEDAPEESLSGYGVYTGGVVFENLLPDATGGPPKELASQTKTDLADDGGCIFQFVTYVDDRAD